MKTKVRLNCYFFSNLIVGLLTLNCLFSNDKVLVEVKKDGGKLEPIYVIADTKLEENKEEEVKNDIKEEVKNEVKVQSVSVTKKTLASKKVINYIKPSYNSVTGTNLVNYAKHYLGLPYVSAGRSLERGTDCSGFTRLIFREFGINLGTTVGSQLYSGSYVSKSDLQPGGLVFYGYSTKASHVAIYIGGGQIIHESNPRDGVKISPVNIMVYITARRLITKDVVKEEQKEEKKVEIKPEIKKEVKEEVKEETKETPKVSKTEQTLTPKPEEKKETPVVKEKETSKEEIKKDENKSLETSKKEEVKEEKVEPQKEEVKEEVKKEEPKIESKVETPKVEVFEEEVKEVPPKQEEKKEEVVVPEVKPEVVVPASPKVESPSIEENKVDTSQELQEKVEETSEILK